jgi:hypothetical protein
MPEKLFLSSSFPFLFSFQFCRRVQANENRGTEWKVEHIISHDMCWQRSTRREKKKGKFHTELPTERSDKILFDTVAVVLCSFDANIFSSFGATFSGEKLSLFLSRA